MSDSNIFIDFCSNPYGRLPLLMFWSHMLKMYVVFAIELEKHLRAFVQAVGGDKTTSSRTNRSQVSPRCKILSKVFMSFSVSFGSAFWATQQTRSSHIYIYVCVRVFLRFSHISPNRFICGVLAVLYCATGR